MALHRLRKLLFAPTRFFEDEPPRTTLRGAAAVVALLALTATLAVAAIGWLLASSVDATVTRTLVEPPNSTCASFAEMNETTNVSSIPEPCTIDEPKTEQVDVGSLVWKTFAGNLPVVFFSVVLGWLLVAAALHVVSAVFDGEGTFGATLSVAGWAMVPRFVQLGVGIAVAALAISGTDFSGDPEVLRRQFEQFALALDRPVGKFVGALVVVWQVAIWAGGLQRARGMSPLAALWVASLVGAVTMLFVLVG